jgi:Rad3-related DNA helicase
MPLKVLRPYQADLIDEVLRTPGHILVQAPTGSGKTLQIIALCHLLKDDYDRILIAAPQQQIEEGFTSEAGSVTYPYDARAVPLPEIKASRESSLRSRQYL